MISGFGKRISDFKTDFRNGLESGLMMKLRLTFTLLLGMLGLMACTTATPTPTSVSDSFFSGQAWLDVNTNGQIDAQDIPLPQATFLVRLSKGEFGANTDSSGKAFVTVPGPVEYPVIVTMQAPKDSGLVLLEPSIRTLQAATGESSQFLFGQP